MTNNEWSTFLVAKLWAVVCEKQRPLWPPHQKKKNKFKIKCQYKIIKMCNIDQIAIKNKIMFRKLHFPNQLSCINVFNGKFSKVQSEMQIFMYSAIKIEITHLFLTSFFFFLSLLDEKRDYLLIVEIYKSFCNTHKS